MNMKEASREAWSRLTPETRCNLRNLYRTMRQISDLDRLSSGCYVSWAASAARLEATLQRCGRA